MIKPRWPQMKICHLKKLLFIPYMPQLVGHKVPPLLQSFPFMSVIVHSSLICGILTLSSRTNYLPLASMTPPSTGFTHTFQPSPVTPGVPQGSILGSLLFIISFLLQNTLSTLLIFSLISSLITPSLQSMKQIEFCTSTIFSF